MYRYVNSFSYNFVILKINYNQNIYFIFCFKVRLCSKSGVCPAGTKCGEGDVCVKSCTSTPQCSCGEQCVAGACRLQCASTVACPQGHVCRFGACTPGCAADTDCAHTQSCVAGKCADPCEQADCAPTAECRVSNHNHLCTCPQGLQGNPKVECRRVECVSDNDCETSKQCRNGQCVNPCAQSNACGSNAQCKTIHHTKECSCPSGYIGNPNVQCTKDKNLCLSSPCGENAICNNLVGTYECKCKTGCTGDAYSGCLCGSPLTDPCRLVDCGLNAQCRVQLGQVIICFLSEALIFLDFLRISLLCTVKDSRQN